MKRIILTSVAALTAFGVAAASPPKAEAFFVAPAVAAAVIGGSVATGAIVGAGIANDRSAIFGYEQPYRYDQPYAGCHYGRALVGGLWRRALICP